MSFMPLAALELCDLCHDLHALRKVHFDGRQFLCRKCLEEKPEPKPAKIPTVKTAWQP